MELKEAIELLTEFKKTGYHTLMIKHNWDRITTNKKIEYAIDTVLEELNNRIPRKDIEDKKRECENRQFSDFTNEPNFAVEKVLNELLNKE